MPAAVRDLEHASALSGRDFERFSSLAKEKFGLDLRRGKEELVAGRLRKKMKELNLSSFAAYYEHVIHDSSGEALVALIDSLATNHTSFLREDSAFRISEKPDSTCIAAPAQDSGYGVRRVRAARSLTRSRLRCWKRWARLPFSAPEFWPPIFPARCCNRPHRVSIARNGCKRCRLTGIANTSCAEKSSGRVSCVYGRRWGGWSSSAA